ncbi:helix-turn-helix transcriptional regulator [Marinobacterium aestuariivivens]|uniref:Helix-turn-helix transcriptional regulator n=1 Tax=Marinobacterium aestuariivivens TaxID=1698799 RepID=A0ABW2A335_9GAMM
MKPTEQIEYQRLLRLAAVLEVTGQARSTLYLRIQQGEFPKPIKLGNSRSVAWVESEVQDWVQQQINNAVNA